MVTYVFFTLIALGLVLGLGAVVMRVVAKPSGGQLGSGQSPSTPVGPAPASASANVVVHLRGGGPLAALVRDHANTAESQGLRPFLEFGATWCPPSRMFGEILDDPRMQAALAGVYLIRAEIDDFAGDPFARQLRAVAVPVFYELDAEGQATGRTITGAAWGEDTIENMSRTMSRFFAG